MLLLFRFCSARVKLCRHSIIASARCFDALRLLNMTENFNVSAVNRLIRPFSVFLFNHNAYPVIPSVVEESRGNGLVMFWIRFREMFRQAQHDRKQILRDEKQLLPLFSVGATIGRPLSVIKNKTFFSRLVIRTKHYAHHTRTVIPVRNVLTRCHSERSRGISWKRTRRLIYRPSSQRKVKRRANRPIRRLSACKSAGRPP